MYIIFTVILVSLFFPLKIQYTLKIVCDILKNINYFPMVSKKIFLSFK